MSPIERYGVVALVFLVATIVAVVVWDPAPDEGDEPEPEQDVAALDRAADDASGGARPNDRPRRGAGKTQRPAVNAGEERPERRSGGATPRANGGGSVNLGGARSRLLDPESEVEPNTDTNTNTSGKPDAGGSDQGSGSRKEETPPASDPSHSLALRTNAPPADDPKDEPRPRGPETREYRLGDNETLSEVAMRELGTWTRWKEIADLNGIADPAKVRAGTVLLLPVVATAGDSGARGTDGRPARVADVASGGAASGPARSDDGDEGDERRKDYRVQKGESLWRIAAARLGDGNRWTEIAALNPDVDPDRIVEGLWLALPEGPARGAGGAQRPSRLVASAPAPEPRRKRGVVR